MSSVEPIEPICIQQGDMLTLFKRKVAELLELFKSIPTEQRSTAWNYWHDAQRSMRQVQSRSDKHLSLAGELWNGPSQDLKADQNKRTSAVESIRDSKKPVDQKSDSVKKTTRSTNEEKKNSWEAEVVEATDMIRTDDGCDSNDHQIDIIEVRTNPDVVVKQKSLSTVSNSLPVISIDSNPETTSDFGNIVHVQVERVDGDVELLTISNGTSTDEMKQVADFKNNHAGNQIQISGEQFRLKKLSLNRHKFGRKRNSDALKNKNGVKSQPKRRKYDELCIPVKQENGKEVFQCKLCGAQMALYQNLEVHLRSHTGQRPFVCSVCGKSFTTKGNMKEHEAIHKMDRPQFECETCGKMFKQSKSLKVHTRIHTGEKPFKCHICEKSFTQPVVLQNHLLIHTNKKNHLCVTCGKSFRLKSHLELHLKRHGDKRDFKCGDCGFKALTKHDLLRHTLKHTGEKPFVCSQCPKRFTRAHYLKEHINTHTGKTPFSCTECDASFSLATKLQTHKRKHRRELAEKLIREAQSNNIVTQSSKENNQSVNHIRIQTVGQTGDHNKSENTIRLLADSEKQSNLQDLVKQTPLIVQQPENQQRLVKERSQDSFRILKKESRDSPSLGIENFWAGDEQSVELVIGENISVEDFNTLLASKVITVNESEGTVIEPGISISVQE